MQELNDSQCTNFILAGKL